jgi:hypothetical protein
MAAAIGDYEAERGSLENRITEFNEGRTEPEPGGETSAQARYEQGMEESLVAEMRTKTKLLEDIRKETNSRNREELIQRGIRAGLLKPKEADELRGEQDFK